MLYYFKYFNFTIETINKIFNLNITLKEIILPIGISFFTFQGLSYVVDVYQEKVPPQKNILKVALYIALFPQLVAGPIVRYTDIEKEINHREVRLEDFCKGIEIFIIGMFKKVILANTLGLIADSIWDAGVIQNTIAIAWLGIISYTLQIFFDFSGYSDMAIGLGRMFGFHFNKNFDFPYISSSISEFWRRWHISLSSWFRDYVYIPLGGNRKRVYLNLAIIFLLTGIWHGAAWNFIFWGIWHGIFILIERFFKRKDINLHVPKFLAHIYTLFVVMIGWVFFKSEGVKYGFKYILSMFGLYSPIKPGFDLLWYLNAWNIFILVIAILMSTPLPGKIARKITQNWNENVVSITKNMGLLILFFFTITRMVSNTYNPFIYFQF